VKIAGNQETTIMASKSRREQLEEMLAEDPNDPFLHYALALEHVSLGRHDLAASRLQTLIQSQPEYVPAYLQAAKALQQLGKEEEARAVLRSGITMATQKGDTHAALEMEGMLNMESF
jgi:Tfp pilus assembly protein PilF